jgi:hypothetical protein
MIQVAVTISFYNKNHMLLEPAINNRKVSIVDGYRLLQILQFLVRKNYDLSGTDDG